VGTRTSITFILCTLLLGAPAGRVHASQGQIPNGDRGASAPPAAAADGTAAEITPPPDYKIGPGDQLSVIFWREKDLSGDVTVRPDGIITLPLINDVQAAGLSPGELRQRVVESARKFVTDPTATVVVREINSRKVFITGEVEKPGTYPLLGPMSVLQLIAMAGGLREFADGSRIVVIRYDNGKRSSLRFNYKEVEKERNLGQNVDLRPGDTVVVP
jgi:polysaccharide export outer membrane protein